MAKPTQRRKGNPVSARGPVLGSVAFANASWPSRDWLWGAFLVLAVLLAYQPVWYAGYIWDDDLILTSNPCIVGPLGIKEIWTTRAADICPLTLSTFWLEHSIWGLHPLPYHLVNVLLHGACAVALWRVLLQLGVPGAWLGAALWALHPVQVESVAWVSEMKNTESGLFFLLSIFFFLRWLRDPGGWSYGLTLLFAAMAMSSKSSTVILPVILCLCAWWKEGRWQWRYLVKVSPVILMSIAASAVSIWAVTTVRINMDPQAMRNWPESFIVAGDAIWFYLGKLLWPQPLVMVYPFWPIDSGRLISYVPLLAVIGVMFFLWIKRESWGRSYFFAFTYFLVALVPVLGLVDAYVMHLCFVADHFQYLASMGPLALMGAGLVRLTNRFFARKTWAISALSAGLLLVLGLLSWERAWVYQNDETLWTDTLAKNPKCWSGHNNIGNALYRKGQVDEAIVEYHTALELYPRNADALYNLGIAFAKKGQMDAAIAQWKKSLEIDPRNVKAHNNLGQALLEKGQVVEAVDQFQKDLEINPDDAEVRSNLGGAFLQEGRLDDARAQYLKALEIAPRNANIRNNLGASLLKDGQVAEAIAQYQKALEIDPHNAKARYGLGLSYTRIGQVDEGIAQYRMAIEVMPNYAEAHNNLGGALFQKGELNEAMAEFQKAVEIKPYDANVHNNLGAVLLQKGEANAAIAQFQEALQVNPHDSFAQKNLAKAQAMARSAAGSK